MARKAVESHTDIKKLSNLRDQRNKKKHVGIGEIVGELGAMVQNIESDIEVAMDTLHHDTTSLSYVKLLAQITRRLALIVAKTL